MADALPTPCRHHAEHADGRPIKTGAATPQRDHPIDHHVTGTSQYGSADRGKAGRSPHPAHAAPSPPPEEPMT